MIPLPDFAAVRPWFAGFECRAMDFVLGVFLGLIAGILIAWGVMK